MQHPIHLWKGHYQVGRIYRDDDEEEKTVWFDCLTGLDGSPAMDYERLAERNMEDFGMKNGRVLEEGLEDIDLNVGKLSEFSAGDKMDKTEKKKEEGKTKESKGMSVHVKLSICHCT